MLKASGRWLGVRLDLLISLFIGTVAIVAVLISQDAGMFNLTSTRNSFKGLLHYYFFLVY